MGASAISAQSRLPEYSDFFFLLLLRKIIPPGRLGRKKEG
jgi:hypothetical protein